MHGDDDNQTQWGVSPLSPFLSAEQKDTAEDIKRQYFHFALRTSIPVEICAIGSMMLCYSISMIVDYASYNQRRILLLSIILSVICGHILISLLIMFVRGFFRFRQEETAVNKRHILAKQNVEGWYQYADGSITKLDAEPTQQQRNDGRKAGISYFRIEVDQINGIVRYRTADKKHFDLEGDAIKRQKDNYTLN